MKLFRTIILAVLVLLTAFSPLAAEPPVTDPDSLVIVDCLLAPKVRRLGRNRTYLAKRRPLKTSALECRIRGGEYTEFDRANLVTALSVWLDVAKAGDAEAQYYTGQIYERGLGRDPDYTLAAHWYSQAAEGGHTAAQVAYAYLLEEGLGVDADPVAALNWYRKASGLPEDMIVLEAGDWEALQKELVDSQEEIEALESALAEAEKAARMSSAEKSGLQGRVNELQTKLTMARSRESDLSKQLVTVAKVEDSATNFGPYAALVIGNGNYRHLDGIQSAHEDARSIADVLKKRYRCQVNLLLDATRLDILKALNDYRENLSEEHNLLIYYAGHSHQDHGRTWWQPVDAEPENPKNWLLASQVADHLEQIPARHVLVLSDSAFPAVLTRSSVPVVPRGSTAQRQAYVDEMLGKRIRLALTSGALKPVVRSGKHSVFASALLQQMKEEDGVLEATELYRSLNETFYRLSKKGELDQVPGFAPIQWAGHEGGGDFFLVARD